MIDDSSRPEQFVYLESANNFAKRDVVRKFWRIGLKQSRKPWTRPIRILIARTLFGCATQFVHYGNKQTADFLTVRAIRLAPELIRIEN